MLSQIILKREEEFDKVPDFVSAPDFAPGLVKRKNAEDHNRQTSILLIETMLRDLDKKWMTHYKDMNTEMDYFVAGNNKVIKTIKASLQKDLEGLKK